MRTSKDVYSGDVKIGTLEFQSTEKGHSGMTTVEMAFAMSRAVEAFKNSLISITDENPKLTTR